MITIVLLQPPTNTEHHRPKMARLVEICSKKTSNSMVIMNVIHTIIFTNALIIMQKHMRNLCARQVLPQTLSSCDFTVVSLTRKKWVQTTRLGIQDKPEVLPTAVHQCSKSALPWRSFTSYQWTSNVFGPDYKKLVLRARSRRFDSTCARVVPICRAISSCSSNGNIS